MVCLEDSITFGSGVTFYRKKWAYSTLLSQLLVDDWEVSNYGLIGRTLLQSGDKPYIKEKQYHHLLLHPAEVYLIMLGTNDSKLVNWNAKQYEKELEQSIMTLQVSSPKVKIYLLTHLWSQAIEDKKVRSILFVIFSSTRNLSNYSACELEKMCRND